MYLSEYVSVCVVYLQSLIVMPMWQESVTLCVSSSHTGICYQRFCLSFLDALVLLAHLNCVSNLSDHKETHSFPGDSNSWLESESSASGVHNDETRGLWKKNSVLATCCRSQTTETEIEPYTFFRDLASWEDRASSVISFLEADYLGRGYKGMQSLQSGLPSLVRWLVLFLRFTVSFFFFLPPLFLCVWVSGPWLSPLEFLLSPCLSYVSIKG